MKKSELRQLIREEIYLLMETKFECMECGHIFNRKLGKNTYEVKCPKCKGYDIDLAESTSLTEKKKLTPRRYNTKEKTIC